MQAKPPLLSICLATYNASHLLRVTLGAALPQVAAARGRVELLVVDDVSTDDTPAVVEDARKHGPLRYIRNDKNLGVNGNLVHGPSQHAKGEFIWVWNQHCLLYPGALERLLGVLDQNHLDVFYANFRCASYPEDWPAEAAGGYDGPFRYLSNPDLENRSITRWQDLLDARNCVCTQSYAHIVRREIWTNYWATHVVGESFRNALTAYPHTCMLVESVFDNPSYYIGAPVITIYNGAQSWGALKSRAKVYFLGYPDLMGILKKKGWTGVKLADAQRFGAEQVGNVVVQALHENRRDVLGMVPLYLWRYGTHHGVVPALWKALLVSRCCWLARTIVATGHGLGKTRKYIFHNCRPARWIRAKCSRVKI